jgi:hypothetical protein
MIIIHHSRKLRRHLKFVTCFELIRSLAGSEYIKMPAVNQDWCEVVTVVIHVSACALVVLVLDPFGVRASGDDEYFHCIVETPS